VGLSEEPTVQPPADFAALEDLIVRMSDFAWKHRESLHEMELNPVWVGAAGEGAMPLDALIAFHADQGGNQAIPNQPSR